MCFLVNEQYYIKMAYILLVHGSLKHKTQPKTLRLPNTDRKIVQQLTY